MAGNNSTKKAHRLYTTWAGMIQRCTNPATINYKNYGGIGITVCDRWRFFDNFLADMGAAWKPDLWLERENNMKGYCPENCVWATTSEQQKNKSTNRFFTLNGVTKTTGEWSTELGGSEKLVYNRLKWGWPLDKALTTPPDRRFQ